ncbi:MAG: hypothetical protein ACKOKE_03730 [Actinomycetota bacterium]
MAATVLFAAAVAATILGLATSSRDALLTGLVAGIGCSVLLVLGAARSGRAERDPDR